MENVVSLDAWKKRAGAPAAPARPAGDWDPEALKRKNAENAERLRRERESVNSATKRRYRISK